jgi:hypothetical protein
VTPLLFLYLCYDCGIIDVYVCVPPPSPNSTMEHYLCSLHHHYHSHTHLTHTWRWRWWWTHW